MGGGRTKEVHNSFNSRVITENLKIRARQFMPCDNLIFLRTTDISSTTGMKFCYWTHQGISVLHIQLVLQLAVQDNVLSELKKSSLFNKWICFYHRNIDKIIEPKH